MLSFRYSSILIYTFLCFSAGTSKGAINPQNETILARVRRAPEPTFSFTKTQETAIVAKINGWRDTVADIATDMTRVAYSKCLAEIAEELVKKCDTAAPVKSEKYGKNKKVDAIFFDQETAASLEPDAVLETIDKTLTDDQCAKGAACIRYAKAINKESYEVGCAFKECTPLGPGTDNKKSYVCLLGPALFKGGAPYTKGDTRCGTCPNDKCIATKICKPPADFKATASECPKPDSNGGGDSGSNDKEGDKKGGKGDGKKKKSMGVQSAKPQTVLAVAVTAILSLFLAH